MDWSSLLPGRNVTNEDLVKGLIQEGRLQHPRAAQAMLKANYCSDNLAAKEHQAPAASCYLVHEGYFGN